MTSEKKKTKREENDAYYTPSILAEFITRSLKPADGASLLDLGAGRGAFSIPWRGPVTAIDIDAEGLDYIRVCRPGIETIVADVTRWEDQRRWDYCIGNPPFFLAMEFIKKAVQHADTVALLLPTSFLGSGDRLDAMYGDENPLRPAELWHLQPRPSFVGKSELGKSKKKGSDKYDFTVFVWTAVESLPPRRPTRAYWKRWCRRRGR